MVTWYQLEINSCHREEAELLSDVLEETGALSIMLTDKYDDPVLEPELGTAPLWPHVVIHALYTEEQAAQQAMQDLLHRYDHLCCCVYQLPEKDWERAWMDDFKPQRFGQRLWVCPSWLEPPEPTAVNLILDPGLAFGTGTHPTTSLCLSWLDSAELSHKTMIDYGCGSGILALAALKLGASEVYAVDIDEQALQATKNNALTNAIDEKQLTIGFPNTLQGPVDLLVANILLGPLITLANLFRRLLKENGTVVVSGILEEQAASLVDAYAADFILESSMSLEGWSLLAFRCR